MNKKIYTKIEGNERVYAVHGEISCSCAHCDTYQVCCDGDQYITTNNKELAKILNGYVGFSKTSHIFFNYKGQQYDRVDEEYIHKILPFFNQKEHWVSTEYSLDKEWEELK